MTSLNSQSTGPISAGSRAKALAWRHLDAGQRRHRGIERRLVDGDDPGAQLGQHPAPAAGAGAEVEAELAGCRAPIDQSQRLPELEIGAVGRALRDPRRSGASPLGKGLLQSAAARMVSPSSSIQEPSGAAGRGLPERPAAWRRHGAGARRSGRRAGAGHGDRAPSCAAGPAAAWRRRRWRRWPGAPARARCSRPRTAGRGGPGASTNRPWIFAVAAFAELGQQILEVILGRQIAGQLAGHPGSPPICARASSAAGAARSA